jgi:predicted HicB family RNase H-like nuclease
MGRLSKVFDKAKEEQPLQQEITKERSNEFVNLNFKVDPETRRKLKQYAAKHDLSLKDVFEAAIAYYIDHHP